MLPIGSRLYSRLDLVRETSRLNNEIAEDKAIHEADKDPSTWFKCASSSTSNIHNKLFVKLSNIMRSMELFIILH